MIPDPFEGAQPVLGDRSLFPDVADVYLGWAAIAPPSLLVRQQVEAFMASYARGGLQGFGQWLPQRARFKERAAALIGAEPIDLALCQSTTQGIIALARSIDWRAGDRVVVFDGEFPANVTPWQRVAADFDLELVSVPLAPFARSHEEGLTTLEAALAPGVRMVAVSAVQFQSGLRMPVPAIAERVHRAGGELFVDAIQALGVGPVDVARGTERAIDYLATGGHKWLGGLEGSGFVYIAPERVEALRPSMAGWLSHEGALDFLLEGSGHLRYDRSVRRQADFLEPGAQSQIGFAALEAGLVPPTVLGPEAIHAHVQVLHDAYEPLFVERGYRSLRATEPAARSAILSFEPPPDHDVVTLQKTLREAGIVAAIPDGMLRLAPHWCNSLDEVPRIERALR
ncbi:MAG: cysteine desulfurase [Sandaracinus sp.]|nr:cysteine desulfurase [Sandaracinus sp.]